MSIERPIEIRILGADDGGILAIVAEGVFDGPVNTQLVSDFLADPRHHLAVAIEEDQVVGMASGVHYIHPDKSPELWINEVGVASTHRGRGLGKRLLAALLDLGATLGCREAWVLTEKENAAARRLYSSSGGVKDGDGTELYTFQLGRERSLGSSLASE